MAEGISREMFLVGLVAAILISTLVSTMVSMQLAVGPKGEKGDVGPQGLQGLHGTQGLQGPQGTQGVPAPSGYVSVSILAFIPQFRYGPLGNVNLTYMQDEGFPRTLWASVQLPDNATITNMTAYLYDKYDQAQIAVELWGFNVTSNSYLAASEYMAHLETSVSGASPDIQVLYTDSISDSGIDNKNCIYGFKLFASGSSGDEGLLAVVLGYKY